MGIQRILMGTSVAPGIAIGPAVICCSTRPMQRRGPGLADPITLDTNLITREIERLQNAFAATDAALIAAAAQLKSEGQPREARVFATDRLLLAEPTLRDRAIALIAEGSWLAVDAIVQAGSEQARIFESSDDPTLRATATEVRMLVTQIWRLLAIDTTFADRMQQPAILVADSIGPAELMSLPRHNVLGIVLAQGGLTSHAVILIRAWSIPAVIGLGDRIFAQMSDGFELALDGTRSTVVMHPDVDTITQMRTDAEALAHRQRELRSQRDQRSVTRDGKEITLLANVSALTGAHAARDWGAAGVGSLRTELLFLGRSGLPDEDAQVEIYLSVAAALPGCPIVARTLDMGGDKQLPLFPLPREDNPFLGWRGIRIGLTHPQELLLPQLRAMLRAGAVADIRIVAPMITTLQEWRQVRALVAQAHAELGAAGLPCTKHPQLGILIEVPAAALIVDQLAREADFISIGSNDLIQYTMACDRTNPHVAHLYQPLDPAILHLIHTIIAAAHRHGRKVSLCGEMASDPTLTTLLIGLGIDELSCTPPALPAVRAAVRATSLSAARVLADSVLQASTLDEVRLLVAAAS